MGETIAISVPAWLGDLPPRTAQLWAALVALLPPACVVAGSVYRRFLQWRMFRFSPGFMQRLLLARLQFYRIALNFTADPLTSMTLARSAVAGRIVAMLLLAGALLLFSLGELRFGLSGINLLFIVLSLGLWLAGWTMIVRGRHCMAMYRVICRPERAVFAVLGLVEAARPVLGDGRVRALLEEVGFAGGVPSISPGVPGRSIGGS